MKKILKPLFALTLGISLASCSNDDDSNPNIVDPSETAFLYATSHDGTVTRYDINGSETVTYQTSSGDAEGIYYDDDDDSFTIASRSSSNLQNYVGVNDLGSSLDIDLDLDFAGSTDLSSPRDIAVDDNIYVVADNSDVDGDEATADGRFYIYTKNSSGFQLRNTVTVNFSVWGITLEDDKLYAVVDNTNQLAVFDNFLSTYTNNTEATATKTVTIEGITRTHGLDYDDGTMVLTDIGDADLDSDGGFHVINDFESKLNATEDGGMISLEDQIRFEGSNTSLGNPVNVVYDGDYDTVFIAELANGGGKVLAFSGVSMSEGGDVSPQINNSLTGASAVYFHTED